MKTGRLLIDPESDLDYTIDTHAEPTIVIPNPAESIQLLAEVIDSIQRLLATIEVRNPE